MFNITPSEFIMIAVLALFVLGPDRLPEMARNLGKMINRLRHLTADLQETVNSISDDPTMKPLKDLGELATRPRQKLAQFAAEAEAEERAERIARERAAMEEEQHRLLEATADATAAPEDGGDTPDSGANGGEVPATGPTDSSGNTDHGSEPIGDRPEQADETEANDTAARPEDGHGAGEQ